MHEKGEKSLHYLGKFRTWTDQTTTRVGVIYLDAAVQRFEEDMYGGGSWVLNKCVYTLELPRAGLEEVNAKVAAEDAAQAKSAYEDVRRLEKEIEAPQEKVAELQNRERNQ